MKVFLTEQQIQLIKEAIPTQHFEQRIYHRLLNLGITDWEKNKIGDRLDYLVDTPFDPKISFGVLVWKFKVSKNNPNFFMQAGKWYYRVFDENGKDSTGDELWVIIRQDKISTFMLKKSHVINTEQELKSFLRVDEIVYL